MGSDRVSSMCSRCTLGPECVGLNPSSAAPGAGLPRRGPVTARGGRSATSWGAWHTESAPTTTFSN